MMTDSAGGGHGPILLGKVETGGGGSIASAQISANSHVNLQGDLLPQAEIFYIGCVKNLGFW